MTHRAKPLNLFNTAKRGPAILVQTIKMASEEEHIQQGDEHHGRNGHDSGEVIGSAALRPVFLGNLMPNFSAEQVTELFTRPIAPPGTAPGTFKPIPVDRVDMKRGYCFVFLKDAATQDDKERAERFVSEINGM